MRRLGRNRQEVDGYELGRNGGEPHQSQVGGQPDLLLAGVYQSPAPRYKQRLDPRTQTTYYEHRAIAEWKLGRSLLAGEVVHHVNGDTRDNHPQNIWGFSLQRAHMIYHNYRWQQERGMVHLFSVEEVLRAMGESWLA